LKFLVRLGKTPTEATRLLHDVYGDDTISRARAFECHKRFKEGRGDADDNPRSSRPATSRTEEDVELVHQKVHGGRRLTVRMIANEFGMNCERVWTIITEDLGMRKKICAKMVPKLLIEEQKERRV